MSNSHLYFYSLATMALKSSIEVVNWTQQNDRLPSIVSVNALAGEVKWLPCITECDMLTKKEERKRTN